MFVAINSRVKYDFADCVLSSCSQISETISVLLWAKKKLLWNFPCLLKCLGYGSGQRNFVITRLIMFIMKTFSCLHQSEIKIPEVFVWKRKE